MSLPKVLIVEDEGVIAMDLQLQLKRLGYAVSAIVSSGYAAIAHAEHTAPDVVLMDVGLPGPLDGADAARHIQEQCRIPVIFLTAHADVATLEKIGAIKPAGYILKPYQANELRRAIDRVLKPSSRPDQEAS